MIKYYVKYFIKLFYFLRLCYLYRISKNTFIFILECNWKNYIYNFDYVRNVIQEK